MGLFSFAKDVGDKIFKKKDDAPAPTTPEEPSAQEVANSLLKRVQDLKLPIEGLKVQYFGAEDKVVVAGVTETQADRERVILALGNAQYVATVEDQIEVKADEPESRMYTVTSGDTLSKIAKEMYGNAGQYMKIFEANKPMLSDPDKIFPGQVLRIPE